MRIRDPEVTFLSLCPRGKNRIPVLYKADSAGGKGEIEFAALLKDDALEEKGELWAVVYAPGLTDTDGHYATREDVAKMQRSHMRHGGKLDLRHDGRALTPDEAYLAETFLVQKGDARFVGMKTEQGTAIDEEGAWATRIQVEAASLRKEYREGRWGGVSLFGRAFLEPVEKEQGDARAASEELVQALARVLKMTPEGASPKQETDMDEATLRRVLAEERATLLKEVDTKITTALEPLKPKVRKADEEDEDPDEPPKFVGKLSNPFHVKRHLQKMRAWEKKQTGELDFADSASVEEHLRSLLGKSDEDEDEVPEFLRGDSIDEQLDAYDRKRRAPSARRGGRALRKSTDAVNGRELALVADRMAGFINGTPIDEFED